MHLAVVAVALARGRQLRQGQVELLAVERDEARQLGHGGVEQHALGRLDVRGRLVKPPKGTSIPGTPVVGLALIPGSQGHEPIGCSLTACRVAQLADRAHAIQESLGLVGIDGQHHVKRRCGRLELFEREQYLAPEQRRGRRSGEALVKHTQLALGRQQRPGRRRPRSP